MRPSKNVHLLALLRKELRLQQSDVAVKIGVSVRTIRRIELGSQKLTSRLAEVLGDAYDVDPSSLIENNLEKGLRTRDGRRWTAKVRLEIRDRLRRWGDLEPYVRQAQRGISAALLYQYLQIANILRKLPDPEDRLVDWVKLFDLSLSALLHSQPTAEHWTAMDELDPKMSLETVFDDLQAIWSDQQLVRRTEKRQSKHNEKDGLEYRAKRTYAGLLGWNERGLVATKLIEELGIEKVVQMRHREFIRLVQKRCQKEGVRWPKAFDPFQAIVNWHEEEVKTTSARKN
jgi:transcriptional regulator with XRE-family HTH domain